MRHVSTCDLAGRRDDALEALEDWTSMSLAWGAVPWEADLTRLEGRLRILNAETKDFQND